MERVTTVRISTSLLEPELPELELTSEQALKMQELTTRMARDLQDAMAYAMLGMIRPASPTRAQLMQSAYDLKHRRQQVYRALLELIQVRPMPTLIVPKDATSPKDWIIQPPQETPEETKARSMLADLTVQLRRVLLQLADLQGMPEAERLQMLQREMML
ncbi:MULTISPECIES: hypothetical protein [unclassified Rhizobium]|uniref:hypothetical protein n=1 Tax=unclassified Rhizobium TaxID=2613769 RepID=UPI0016188B58|nr:MULTISPECIES: hypothetical protein [unclassified Rhizobium]MBB3386002.1 hypothetical protein [Rhizobium sp. BK098]MBB3617821.1 hypothetical protein [Rhizobium sp. BK609]MBB3683364.1 hypothetical protein [Rhizobium sp. BK612]